MIYQIKKYVRVLVTLQAMKTHLNIISDVFYTVIYYFYLVIWFQLVHLLASVLIKEKNIFLKLFILIN